MIYHLKGKIIDIAPGLVVVDVGGVGYGVFVPERLIGSQLEINQEISLFTVTIVSQDDLRLFGFLSGVDREFFRMMLKIPRIGPKGAMKILSSAPAASIMKTILAGDTKALAKYPGVGPTVAGRLIIELREKVKLVIEESGEQYEDIGEEAVEALIGLGCSPEEARGAISKARASFKEREFTFEDLLNTAFQIMAEREA